MKTPAPVQTPPTTPPPSMVNSGEVLHSESHSHLSSQEVAKAVARHQREHREQKDNPKK